MQHQRAANVGPTPLRRISILEYNNAARDLFGDTTNPAAVSGFPSDEKVGSFITNTKTPVTPTNNEGYMTAAEGIASRFLARCSSGTACGIDDLIALARRAFHGTLDADAETALRGIFDRASAIDANAGIEAVVRSILLSPRFLYMIEFGSASGNIAQLTQSEIAGRLAAFLWRTVPDQSLLAMADAGQLASPEQITAQARAMLADPRGLAMLDSFALEWLDIADITRVSRDMRPEFTPALRDAMAREAQLMMENAVANRSTRFQDLLTSSQGYANSDLGAFYGVTGGSSPTDFASVQMPANRRGIFMQAAFLTDKAHPQKPSLVLRGKAVREQLLCDRIPAPPPGVERNLTAGEGQTNQDVLSAHLVNPDCVACHKWLDPVGRAFDNFDQIGKYRDNENGLPLTVSGEIVAGPSAPDMGTFTDGIDMMQQLSNNEYVQQCFAIQTARYALGRDEQDGDACSIKSLWDGFAQSFSIQDLLVAVTGTTAFSHRNPVSAGVACR